MTETLMTLLCIEHQSGDVTSRASIKESLYKVLEGHGGKLISSAGASFEVFLFESPTESVLCGTEILESKYVSIAEQIRIVIHTTEIVVSSSALHQDVVDIIAELLSRTPWGDLVLSDATYGSIKHSEISRICESTSWNLKADKRNHQMYRVKIKSDAAGMENDRQQQKAELFSLRRGAKNAPYDRRALAFIVDYLIAIVALGLLGMGNNIPEVWRVYNSRIVCEFEDFNVENVRKDLSWKAYGGELVLVGYQGRLWNRISVEKGNYNVDVVFNEGANHVNFLFQINGFSRSMALATPVEYPLFNSKIRVVENIPLDGDVDISVKIDEDDVTDTVGLDALFITPVGKEYHDSASYRFMFSANRYEDIFRLFGVLSLNNNDVKYVFFFLLRCYPVLIIIDIFFLTFLTWTPGCLLFNLRVVTLRGERPGFVRAFLRGVAAFAGWFTLGYGWFKPLISHDERTWSDSWSRTRLIILE